jgi:pimeloyl-ACP methyl ester carboxylesterase
MKTPLKQWPEMLTSLPCGPMARWFTLCSALFTTLVLPGCGRTSAPTFWVQGGSYRLKTAVFHSAHSTSTPTLVVVLHGDSPFGNPDYQDMFAAKVAAAYKDVVVAAILRPGYTDPKGNVSEGVRGQTTGDNYNAQNTDAIAAAISDLKQRFRSRRVVVVGHSGGAAITANVLGRHPSLVDAALLVSCPCDVARWREHMFQKTQFPGFQGEIETLSPIAQVGGVSANVTIRMVVGGKDDVTPPALSEAYKTAALRAGKHITLTELEGEPHNILLKAAVQAELGLLLH